MVEMKTQSRRSLIGIGGGGKAHYKSKTLKSLSSLFYTPSLSYKSGRMKSILTLLTRICFIDFKFHA